MIIYAGSQRLQPVMFARQLSRFKDRLTSYKVTTLCSYRSLLMILNLCWTSGHS